VVHPKLKKKNLYTSGASLSVRVNTLICVHGLIKSLDKFTITSKLLPLLKESRTREPGLIMATLAVYEEIAKHSDKEICAIEVIPELWKMSVDPLLNTEQFKKCMKVVENIGSKVVEQHLRHLEDLKSMEGVEGVGSIPSDTGKKSLILFFFSFSFYSIFSFFFFVVFFVC